MSLVEALLYVVAALYVVAFLCWLWFYALHLIGKL